MIKQYVLLIAVLFLIGFGAGIQQAQASEVLTCCDNYGRCIVTKKLYCPAPYYWKQ